MRFDRRGHGRSAVPQGPYSIPRLAQDALAVLDGLGVLHSALDRFEPAKLDGAQLGCIMCGLCIDACDTVMKKVDRPTGLIAYDTDVNIGRRAEGKA